MLTDVFECENIPLLGSVLSFTSNNPNPGSLFTFTAVLATLCFYSFDNNNFAHFDVIQNQLSGRNVQVKTVFF